MKTFTINTSIAKAMIIMGMIAVTNTAMAADKAGKNHHGNGALSATTTAAVHTGAYASNYHAGTAAVHGAAAHAGNHNHMAGAAAAAHNDYAKHGYFAYDKHGHKIFVGKHGKTYFVDKYGNLYNVGKHGKKHYYNYAGHEVFAIKIGAVTIYLK